MCGGARKMGRESSEREWGSAQARVKRELGGPWANWSGWIQVAAGLRMGLDGLLGRTLSFLLFSLAENY